MKVKRTQRGFDLVEFKDFNNVACSLQESSLATTRALWLGCDEPNPRILKRNEGWVPYPIPDGLLCDTRMHLDRKQVRSLMRHLNKWLKTGRL